jgi:nitrate reductase gamma subunit
MLDFIKDPSVYNLASGPLVWIAFITFIGGSIYKVYNLIDMAKKDKLVLPYIKLKPTLRSLLHWLVPFASRNWRMRWPITVLTFAFHIGLLFTPIFLVAHTVMIYDSWGISWWTLPEGVADIMTLIVIVSCIAFLLRRIFAEEVKFVTFSSDYLILAISFFPFLTGFMAYHQLLLPHKAMVILHMLFGEIMLIAIPFTRLAHMFYFFLTRALMGSQFAGWKSKDW